MGNRPLPETHLYQYEVTYQIKNYQQGYLQASLSDPDIDLEPTIINLESKRPGFIGESRYDNGLFTEILVCDDPNLKTFWIIQGDKFKGDIVYWPPKLIGELETDGRSTGTTRALRANNS